MQLPCSWLGLPFSTAVLLLCWGVHMYTGVRPCANMIAVCERMRSSFACPPLLHPKRRAGQIH